MSGNAVDSSTGETLLRDYVLGNTIGQGTFSKVKIGRHVPTNQQVAIKMIQKGKILQPADQMRLNKEIKIIRKVRHSNIIQLFEILEDRKYIYVITEYSSGGELFELISARETLTEPEAGKFLLQLLNAVEYMHEIGVVHRDLKPENLLLDDKSNLKVIDFGLSNIYFKGEMLLTACGSPCYAAPQMLKAKPYHGLQADIWSIGVILYAMCFGYLPFDEPQSSVLFKKIIQGNYAVPESASEGLVSILRRILCVDPYKRATIDQIRAHPFCMAIPVAPLQGIILGLSDIPYQPQIEQQMRQRKLDVSSLKQSIKKNKHHALTVTYYLLLQRNLRINNSTCFDYYLAKNNQINRYALVAKVRQNYQRRLHERLAKVQERHYKPQGTTSQITAKKRQSRHKTTEKKKNHSLQGQGSKKYFSPQKQQRGKQFQQSTVKKDRKHRFNSGK